MTTDVEMYVQNYLFYMFAVILWDLSVSLIPQLSTRVIGIRPQKTAVLLWLLGAYIIKSEIISSFRENLLNLV
jgi:hypothetical protein